MSGSDQLIQMANDIGNFFRAQPNREDAIAGIANHIKSFWTRRMRDKLLSVDPFLPLVSVIEVKTPPRRFAGPQPWLEVLKGK